MTRRRCLSPRTGDMFIDMKLLSNMSNLQPVARSGDSARLDAQQVRGLKPEEILLLEALKGAQGSARLEPGGLGCLARLLSAPLLKKFDF